MMDHTIFPVLPQPAQISYPQQTKILNQLIAQAALTGDARARISQNATALIQRIRTEAKPSLIDSFLAEYGLSNAKGVALMRLAEALLRVPDSATIDVLVADKIAPETGQHIVAALHQQ